MRNAPSGHRPDLASLAALFLEERDIERGLSPHTIANYRRAIGILLAMPGCPRYAGDMERAHLVAFTQSLRAQAPALKSGTIATRQRYLWAFVRWLYDCGHIPENLSQRVRKVPVRDEKRRTATEEIRQALVDVALRLPEHPLRNAALIEALWSVGCRRSELAAVQLANYDQKHNTLTFRASTTKTGYARTVGIGVDARLALTRYITLERGTRPGALFLSRMRAPMSSDAMRLVLSGLARLAGVEVSSHDFRRAAAARMLAAGVPADTVAYQLGHATLAMTLQYGQEGRAERAIRAFHDYDSSRRKPA